MGISKTAPWHVSGASALRDADTWIVIVCFAGISGVTDGGSISQTALGQPFGNPEGSTLM
jgi:hypothetical protein